MYVWVHWFFSNTFLDLIKKCPWPMKSLSASDRYNLYIYDFLVKFDEFSSQDMHVRIFLFTKHFFFDSHTVAAPTRPPSLHSILFHYISLLWGGFSLDEATASQIPRAGIEFALRAIHVAQSWNFPWLWDHLTASIFCSPSMKNSPHQAYNADDTEPETMTLERNTHCNIETPFICINSPHDSWNLAADGWMLPGSRYTANPLSPWALEST